MYNEAVCNNNLKESTSYPTPTPSVSFDYVLQRLQVKVRSYVV